MEEIFNRRSIRKYKSKDVEEEKINKILKAGMAAPSAGNEQPWEFIVVTEENLKEKIMDVHPYSDMLKQAPVAILVCGNMTEKRFEGYWEQDCAAATQNMLLMVESLDLGGVWLGVYSDKKRMEGLSKIFDLPEYIVPFSIISIGYPAEEKYPSQRYQAEKVHYNSFK